MTLQEQHDYWAAKLKVALTDDSEVDIEYAEKELARIINESTRLKVKLVEARQAV
jgi:hypothetical protein